MNIRITFEDSELKLLIKWSPLVGLFLNGDMEKIWEICVYILQIDLIDLPARQAGLKTKR